MALHTLVYTWEDYIKIYMHPSVYMYRDHVTIAYDNHMDIHEYIHINIDTQGKGETVEIIMIIHFVTGNVTLANGDDDKNTYTVQDKQLSDIISSLIPDKGTNYRENLYIKMDKFIYFRVILTYLYKNYKNYLH